jgi:fluoroquinolone transport system permease protein
MTLAALISHDWRLQVRYRIVAAYGVVLAVYAGLVLGLGEALPTEAFVLLIYTDPSVLGFYFLGGLMLFERDEGTRAALGVTPVSPTGYLLAKTVTLTALALAAAAILAFAGRRTVDWPLYLAAVSLVSVHYIGLGAVFALRFETVTGYVFGSALWLMPLILPGALAFWPGAPAAAALIPSVAHLELLSAAYGATETERTQAPVTLAAGVAALAAIIAFWMGTRALRRDFGRRK